MAAFLAMAWALAGCGGAQPLMLPIWRQRMIDRGIEGASPVFNAGWRDGCASGSATAARYEQRLFHGFRMEESLVNNDEYYDAWRRAFRYCHRYLYQYHRKSFSN
ncbi:MAG: hypothetical protein ABW189_03435 [Rickettsiales bacterium]